MKTRVAFWDTSALVPLCCSQPALTVAGRRLAREWERKVVWWGTTVEIHSALQRLYRERALSQAHLLTAQHRWQILSDTLRVVEPTDRVRSFAVAVLALHNLRTLDALQLAAALTWCKEKPRGHAFVCFDEQLAQAAEASGFDVVTGSKR